MKKTRQNPLWNLITFKLHYDNGQALCFSSFYKKLHEDFHKNLSFVYSLLPKIVNFEQLVINST